MNKRKILFIILTICTVLPIAVKLFCYVAKLTFINNTYLYVIDIVFLILAVLWLVFVSKGLPAKLKVLKIFIVSVIIGATVVGLGVKLTYGFLENEEIKRFTSPAGKNQVVILQGGFIDAVYYAYPVEFKWFYKEQENGYVSKHDDWGGAEISIDWVNDNKAIVRVISEFAIANEGTNPNDEIVVEFD